MDENCVPGVGLASETDGDLVGKNHNHVPNVFFIKKGKAYSIAHVISPSLPSMI